MSYLVYYRGLKVRVKTIQELDKLADDLASKNKAKENKVQAIESETITPSNIQSFWWDSDLTNPARAILQSLRDSLDGLDTDALAQDVGIESGQIKYGIKRVYSIAKKHKINGKMLIFRKEKGVGRPPKSVYQMKPKMREALQNIPPKSLDK